MYRVDVLSFVQKVRKLLEDIIYAVIRVTIYVLYNAHDIFSLFGDISSLN